MTSKAPPEKTEIGQLSRIADALFALKASVGDLVDLLKRAQLYTEHRDAQVLQLVRTILPQLDVSLPEHNGHAPTDPRNDLPQV